MVDVDRNNVNQDKQLISWIILIHFVIYSILIGLCFGFIVLYNYSITILNIYLVLISIVCAALYISYIIGINSNSSTINMYRFHKFSYMSSLIMEIIMIVLMLYQVLQVFYIQDSDQLGKDVIAWGLPILCLFELTSINTIITVYMENMKKYYYGLSARLTNVNHSV